MKLAKSCLIAFLCMGVFLQILGAPVSFLESDGSEDIFISSLLTGACVHTEDQHIPPFSSFLSAVSISARHYSFQHESLLFHPPIFALRT